jgi:hypothetical protein
MPSRFGTTVYAPQVPLHSDGNYLRVGASTATS